MHAQHETRHHTYLYVCVEVPRSLSQLAVTPPLILNYCLYMYVCMYIHTYIDTLNGVVSTDVRICTVKIGLSSGSAT